MDYKDYYKILGIDRKASPEEIKRAFRKLAMQYHPDRNQGKKSAEEKFKEINEANEVLSDPEKRARYDQLGQDYFRWQQGAGGAGAGPTTGNFNWDEFMRQAGGGGARVDTANLNDLFGGGEGFSDFFNFIFGGGVSNSGRSSRRSTGRAAQKPRDYEQPVTISLEEAYHGASRMLQLDDHRMEVNIPAGAKSGTKVRMAGIGPAGSDIYLVIDVTANPHYERKGDDLYTDISVDLYSAVLGGQVTVPTLAGDVVLTIPAGTQPGQSIRLAGRGMPKLRNKNEHGDLYVRVKVQLPRQLNAQQKALFEKLRGG